MTRWTLLWRNLLFYRRAHFGVVLGVIIGTAVLTGALLVGDCVQATLRENALTRLGAFHFALHHPTRFVTEKLADRLDDQTETLIAPGLFLQGMISLPSSNARANQVSLYGVDERFWQAADSQDHPPPFDSNSIVLNARLAEQLQVEPGDAVILRVRKPTAFSYDAPLSTGADHVLSLRLTVSSIVEDRQMGRFDLRINQVPPLNAYLPLEFLQQETEQIAKINLILAGAVDNSSGEDLNLLLHEHWTLEDAQFELRQIRNQPVAEIRTERIFLDDYLLETLQTPPPETSHPSSILTDGESFGGGVLTYLVNEIRHQDRTVPYSMVSALSNLQPASPHGNPSASSSTGNPSFPSAFFDTYPLQPDEIVINQWLADDLQARPGDSLTLTYYVWGDFRKLEERSRTFTVQSVLPMDHPLCDRTLMPDFAGIAETENSRDWDPGFAVDLDKIRDKDEAYWDTYKGTPKAFLGIQTGQEMWGNRYGNFTSLRIPLQNGIDDLRSTLNQRLNPDQVGMFFQPVRQQALDGVRQAINFAPLFAGFSFFLISAALILVGLLFVFGVEQRAEETGTLRALGFTPKSIQSLYLSEGFILSCIGSVFGVAGGLLYTQGMLWGLDTLWSDAVNNTRFVFVISIPTLMYGLLGGVLMSICAIGLTLRKHSRLHLQELLSGSLSILPDTHPSRRGIWIGIPALLGAAALLLIPTNSSTAQAGVFFGSGTLLLIAAIAWIHAGLHESLKRAVITSLSWNTLSWRNNTRRIGRSMAVISLLACGSFLVIAVGANRMDASMHAELPSSGTGGFTFWGELTVPVLHDLNTEAGLSRYGLTPEDVPNTRFTPVRIRQGDDASCLNLSRAQNPQLFAINPLEFAQRGAFTFVATQEGNLDPSAWMRLNENIGPNRIPAVIDQATMLWALGKSLGDSLYYKDAHGRDIEIVLTGAIANSVFQGGILISEHHFSRHFSSGGGYSLLLIDSDTAPSDAIAQTLSFALEDYGINLVSTEERLAAFNSVQNTYLSIFQLLGGLGLILGSAGIGIVMLRNVLERRSELALMRAVGYTTASLRKLLIQEHAMLLVLGILCGLIAGAAAVAPALLSQGKEVPYLSLTLTLLFMLFSGWVWIILASRFALQGNILAGLRNE